MTFVMYGDGASEARVWWCECCDGVAHYRDGEPMPAHCCHGWVARDGLCLECGERRTG